MNIKNLQKFFTDTFKECQKKHIILLASSSSFFLLLTTVPFILLLAKVIGVIFGQSANQLNEIFDKVSFLFPKNLELVIFFLKGLIFKTIFATKHFTFINLIFLALSSLGFINSIWRGLFIITHDYKLSAFAKFLKGIVIISISIVFLWFALFLPTLLEGLNHIISLPLISHALKFLSIQNTFIIEAKTLSKAHIISFLGITVYLSVLFHYLLQKLSSFKVNLVTASIFSSSLILLKHGLVLYVKMIKTNHVQGEGLYYSFTLAFTWVFVSMILFYFSLIFSIELNKFLLKKG